MCGLGEACVPPATCFPSVRGRADTVAGEPDRRVISRECPYTFLRLYGLGWPRAFFSLLLPVGAWPAG